jgi:hypothetical protein
MLALRFLEVPNPASQSRRKRYKMKALVCHGGKAGGIWKSRGDVLFPQGDSADGTIGSDGGEEEESRMRLDKIK